MKILRNIYVNPIAIAVAVVHWIVVAFSLAFENTQFLSKSYTFDLPEPVIFKWLFYLNIPSFFLVEFAIHPILSLLERNLLSESLGIVILVCCITFQWMFMGYCAACLIKFFKSEYVKLSFKLADKK